MRTEDVSPGVNISEGARVRLVPPFRMQQRCWIAPLAHLPQATVLAEFADNDRAPKQSPVCLLENGTALGPPHAAHALIRNEGRGAFSHWKESLYFSTSDGSDPNTNGRIYEIAIGLRATKNSSPVVNESAGQPVSSRPNSTSGAPSGRSDPESSLQAAGQHFERREWPQLLLVLQDLPHFMAHAADVKLMLARTHLELGQLREADEAYGELAALTPYDADLWKTLGRLRKRVRDFAGARHAWQRLVDLQPDSLEARWELASACWEGGFAEEARAQAEWILARNADHPGALTIVARSLFSVEPERSLTCWLRLAAFNPQAFEPHLQVARLHAQAQRPAEAEAAFRAVLARVPDHPEALRSLALLVGSRDEAEAVALLSRWSAAVPADATPWNILGEMYAGRGKPSAAEVAFRRGLEVTPDNRDGLIHLGRLLRNAGRLDESLEVWRKLADSAPKAVEPRLQIARIFLARRDPHVLDALHMVLAIEPGHQEALLSLAQWLEREDVGLDAALAAWERLAAVNSSSTFALIQRGRLLERCDRENEAEADYRRAVARAPQDSGAVSALTAFYGRHQRWAEAIQVYENHLAAAPGNFEAMLGLSGCLERVGRFPEAQALHDRARVVEPSSVEQRLYRARLLRSLGHLDAAVADFRRVCEVDPANVEAWRGVVVALAKLEREADALAALDEAEGALGNRPAALVALGRAAAAALFDKQAVEYFERAIEFDPASSLGHTELGLFYFERGVIDAAYRHLLVSRALDPGNVKVARTLFDVTGILATLGYDHMEIGRPRHSQGPVLLPERLYDVVLRATTDGSVKPYNPHPRRVIAVTSSLAAGGAERQLALMMKGLSAPEFGLDLTLFAMNLSHRTRRDFFLSLLVDRPIEIVEVNEQAAECLLDPEVAPFSDIVRHFPAEMVGPIALWLREFRRRRPAVVHAWQDSINLMAVVAALLAGVPRIVLCCRSIRPDNPRRRLQRFMKHGYSTVLRHPSIMMSNNSQAGAADYAAWLDIEPDRIEVVYNGIDFDKLSRENLLPDVASRRREASIPKDVPVVGGVFRISEEKRPLLWLEAAAIVARENPAVHFVICGEGPMREEVEAYAKTLGLTGRLHLAGAQSEIGSWYGMMDVFLLASRHEGLSNVLLEAQSLGVPVVAPDVGGVSEVVEQGITGWTVRNADASALAERILFGLNDREWRRRAATRGPQFTRKRFGVEAMLLRNLEVFGISPSSLQR